MRSTTFFCFFAVYVIWGSTYLAIRYAIEDIPPWLLSSARFFIAAALMAIFSFIRKEKKLELNDFRLAAWSGVFLILANGLVGVVESSVPSGVVAVILGAMPIWIMLLAWLAFNGPRPLISKIVGAVLGVIGIAIIAWDSLALNSGLSGASTLGFALLAGSSALWAVGTLLQRKTTNVKSGFRFSAVQMLFGACASGSVSLFVEQPWRFNWFGISSASMIAFWYLIIFGSLIGFSAYSWLSRNVAPHLVSTYALVNPVIAVGLGSLFYQEPITPNLLLATAIILLGLGLIIRRVRTA